MNEIMQNVLGIGNEGNIRFSIYGLKISTYQIFVFTFWKKITHCEIAAQVGKIQLGSRRKLTKLKRVH